MTEVNPGIAYGQVVHAETTAVLGELVAIVNPDEPNANPRDVFDPPSPVRADAPDPGYDAQTEAGVRAGAAKLGVGRVGDLLPSALNLPGEEGEYHIGVTAGLTDSKGEAVIKTVNRILAEHPRKEGQRGGPAIIITGSVHRKLGKTPGETAKTERQGLTPGESTEYDGMAATAAEKLVGTVVKANTEELEQVGFEPLEPPIVLPFGYEVFEDDPAAKTVTCEANDQRTGQAQLIGHVAGQPVIGFGIDAVPKVNPNTNESYFKPPDVTGVAVLLHAMLKSPDVVREAGIAGNNKTPLVFVESATYEPSRKVDAARAGIITGRPVGVSTYGIETLAEVKGVEPVQPDIRQIPGELNRAAEQAEELGALLLGAQ